MVRHRASSLKSLWFLVLLVGLSALAGAQPQTMPLPPVSPAAPNPQGLSLTIGPMDPLTQPQQVSTGLLIVGLLTVLTLAPAILMMVTSFIRIAVVLGFVRRAMGTPEVPPNQVLLGLALFLTFFVMAPTLTRINDEALQPYLDGRLVPQEAYEAAVEPIRDFLFMHCRKSDLALFVRISRMDPPQTREDVPNHVLVPAFVISELKTAFIIGFIIYVPFLIIDMVVSSILLSMGMMMLPPVIISLPFKVLLFVLVDGWTLVIGSLLKSFT